MRVCVDLMQSVLTYVQTWCLRDNLKVTHIGLTGLKTILDIQCWWQYDERTSKDLEASYKNNESTCELLIAGFLYIVDLENMLQIRRNDPSRRRRIKRDHGSIPKKGIAGLPTNKPAHQQTSQPDSTNSESHEEKTTDSEQRPDTSVNEQRESSDEEDYDLEETLQRLDTLNLNPDEDQ